ncbi:MAG: hypothetical protein A2X13_12945 [Bacteroidetes bacterium GWC2_33_15]|nr:MAG: hypothetical protein A2X10_13750 [Bacteroidetes bacterium GWA2_33_15]OFX50686.1 MAG: hypothetical protein A2X13_12945 [Bacteroidetes bacterium GWC2_33_15]OFX63218.1 MAG: hypothetical protein A2X15_01855 [Bacteroidetes bacterium GWB2_32_14]OFX69835.1 MAG: hypothetical protein A2X14_05620 [Bacteroidetes bacterium GWD2_33_33]
MFLLLIPKKIQNKTENMNIIKTNTVKLRTKRTFLKQGTCSRTFFHILNREFGNPKPIEENAIDPLAGGIVQQGYQCGMLWGAAMGVGTESYRRFGNRDKAIGMSVLATQHILKSFISKAKSDNCSEITNTDWSRKFSILKYLITGKMVACFKLAGKWAPDAIQAANEGLSFDPTNLPDQSISCASEVVKRMGGSDEEMVMVAGFAGGFGLSGNACGALSVAIWMNTLARVRAKTYKYSLSDTEFERIIKSFYETTDYKMECREICGKHFHSVNEHTEFIKNGGCEKLINVLSQS